MAKNNKDNSEIEALETNAPDATKTEKPASDVSVFSLEKLRENCGELFKVSPSTFDGAVYGLDGEFTVEEMRTAIKKWQETQVFPAEKEKGGKK